MGVATNRLADLARYSAQVRSNKMTQELGVEGRGDCWKEECNGGTILPSSEVAIIRFHNTRGGGGK